MATTIPNITALPDAPSRNDDPTNFESKADAFLGALPGMVTEENAFATAANTLGSELEAIETACLGYKDLAEDWASLANVIVDSTDYSAKEYAVGTTAPSAKKYANAAEDVEVEPGNFSSKHFSLKSEGFATDAESFKDIAQSIASFVGRWSDQTGAATVPTSVYHSDNYWTLLQDIADITAEEPSPASSVWAKSIVSGNNGAENQTLTGILSLGSQSKLVQNLSSTGSSKSVKMPDATTINEGLAYIFYNSGNYTYSIRNFNDDLVNYLDPGESCLVYLVDNSTSSGEYKVSTFDKFDKNLQVFMSVVFESDFTISPSITRMTDNLAIVCYQDFNNSQFGTACLLDITTGMIVPDTPIVFESASTDSIAVTRMTDDLAIVAYSDAGNSGFGTSRILDITTGSIVVGTDVVFESAGVEFVSITRMTDTKAIVCYQDEGNTDFGTACLLDISTSAIVPATPVVFESADTRDTSITRMTDTKAVVCYKDIGNASYGTACLLDINTGVIVPATPVVFESAAVFYNSVDRLTDDLAIVAYRDNGNSSYGTACLLDINTGVIVPSTPIVFKESGSNDISLTSISSNEAIVCFYDSGNSNYGTACNLSLIDGVITPNTPIIFNQATTSDTFIDNMTTTKAIVCYQDGGNSSYGTADLIERVL